MNDFFTKFKSFAVLGISRNPKAFSRQAYAFMQTQGYQLYPVNPNMDSIDGQVCYPSLATVPEVRAAIFFTPPRITEKLLVDCQNKGIKNVWFQQGSADLEVKQRANELRIDYQDSCVFLHHPEAGFPHNVHRFFVKVFSKEK